MTEQDPRYRLTPVEQQQWSVVRSCPPSREDWEDLQETLIAYKRRRIGRHARDAARQERDDQATLRSSVRVQP